MSALNKKRRYSQHSEQPAVFAPTSSKQRRLSTISPQVSINADVDSGLNYCLGAIQYIKLTNFMSHHDFEWKPGPKINLITGRNGAGKSSILQAIVIGLGEKISRSIFLDTYNNTYFFQVKMPRQLEDLKTSRNLSTMMLEKQKLSFIFAIFPMKTKEKVPTAQIFMEMLLYSIERSTEMVHRSILSKDSMEKELVVSYILLKSRKK